MEQDESGRGMTPIRQGQRLTRRRTFNVVVSGELSSRRRLQGLFCPGWRSTWTRKIVICYYEE